MKPILTPEQAAELDRATQLGGALASDLMERAGRAVARACVDLTGGAYGRRAAIVVGKGNNGGDGLVAARHLARWGMRASVHLMGAPADLREPAATNLQRLLAETRADVRTFDPDTLRRELSRSNLAIDAIFGTGFRGFPEHVWAEAIGLLNGSGVPIVAVDIPSGVDGSAGAVVGAAVRAELTVTFGAAKTGAVLMPGADHAGAVRVVDIGFPDELIKADTFLLEPADVVDALVARDPDAHKRASGTLVVVAGSRSVTGAAKLVASGAGRAGAGYVFVAAPVSALPVIQSGLTETVFVPLPETSEGTVATAALGLVLEHLDGAHALAIGPGLTQHPETARFIRELVRVSPVPSVVDADALNAFAGAPEALADRKSDAVLTPHVGEFARLSHHPAADVLGDRLAMTRELARRVRAPVLLKGSRTVIAAPDGRVLINPTGSPTLATAGTGDVLTGAIAGLLARGASTLEASAAGAYLHGVAGMLAGRDNGDSTLAGDLPGLLPRAIELVVSQA